MDTEFFDVDLEVNGVMVLEEYNSFKNRDDGSKITKTTFQDANLLTLDSPQKEKMHHVGMKPSSQFPFFLFQFLIVD